MKITIREILFVLAALVTCCGCQSLDSLATELRPLPGTNRLAASVAAERHLTGIRGRLVEITFYTANYCQSCNQFKADLKSGYFSELPCTWCEHNVSRNGQPGDFVGAPSFRVSGTGELLTVNPYRREAVRDQLRLMVTGYYSQRPLEGPGSYESSQPLIVPTPVPQPQYELPEPVVETSVSMINWDRLRFIALVPSNSGRSETILRGMGLVLDQVSGGQARAKLIAERTEPNRFRSMMQASGNQGDSGIQLLIMVHEDQRIGFVKGLIAKKIERAAVEKLESADLPVPVDVQPVFQRSSGEWNAIHQAYHASYNEPNSGGQVFPSSSESDFLDWSEVENGSQSGQSWAGWFIATLLSFFLVQQAIRIGKWMFYSFKDFIADFVDSRVEESSGGGSAGTSQNTVPKSTLRSAPAGNPVRIQTKLTS